jgi:putative phosphoribosyl transferase
VNGLRFRNRSEAGRLLGQRLAESPAYAGAFVLGLPRGGVPVAAEVAQAISGTLDVIVVRKLGVPGHEELAFGAVALGARILNAEVVDGYGLTQDAIDRVTTRELEELARRSQAYTGDRPAPALEDGIVVLVDDGLATGSTMLAAVAAARARDPLAIVVAVPVGAPDACAELQRQADELVCLLQPEPFLAVGWWYEDFAQVTDDRVRDLLARAADAAS